MKLTRPVLAAPFLLLLGLGAVYGTTSDQREDKFRQLEEILPTPNSYRTASGAPGHEYWQQRANYDIDVELLEETNQVFGSETVTYFNESPDTLDYLWMQIDPNIYSPESHAVTTSLAPSLDATSFERLQKVFDREKFDGSAQITAVTDVDGKQVSHTVVGTMMRIDIPEPLASGKSTSFKVDWNHEINDHKLVGGRGGYEHFEEDGNTIYEMSQWFPRMAAYTDVNGWQHKQFIGRGEFTLEFGDYHVAITVPGDHIVAAAGVLQNPSEVLTEAQRERLANCSDSSDAHYIVTPEEAKDNESHKPESKKTWIFQADNVRDFAFATSRKFIWDATLHQQKKGDPVYCMSFYPNEGEPLWSQYSTQAIVHTLDVYSDHTFPYPYPVAISVNGPVGGMEYPMICFNGPRPNKDGTYSERTKYGLISVVIHEVGHNYFPMIVNSDERQWTWMDEGLNSFVQYLAEQRWQEEYPSRSGEPRKITRYMASDYQVPIMTNSESILQFGPNAYGKPATALNILRETVMGRDLFDFAFQKYATRWMFKRPMPADLFRTMEDASAVDLDWFWRGWFFTTQHTDMAITDVTRYRIDSLNPDTDATIAKQKRAEEPKSLSTTRNASIAKRIDAHPVLADFYNSFDKLDVLKSDRKKFAELIEGLDEDQIALLESDMNFYVVNVDNGGNLVMPVILEMNYEDGTKEEVRIPAEVWRQNGTSISKLIMSKKSLDHVVLDPHLETADTDLSDNRFPPEAKERTIKLKKSSGKGRRGAGGDNPMRQARKEAKMDAEGASQEDADD